MKYLLRFAFLAAFAVRLVAAESPNTREALGLVGPVRMLTESDVADVSPSKPDGDPFNSVTTSFTSDGYVLEIEDCRPPSCERTTFLWQGPWIVQEQHKSDLVVKTVRYVRGANGQVIKELTGEEYANGGVASCVKTHRDTGMEKEELQFCDDGLSSSRRVIQRQEDTGRETVFQYRYEGDPDGEGGWSLDSQGSVLSKLLADGGTREEFSRGKGKSILVTDGQRRVIEEIDDFPPAYHRMTHVYDQLGREIERAEWRPNGDVINRRLYVYEEDMHGNWTRRTEYFWSAAYKAPVEGQVTIRKIEYF